MTVGEFIEVLNHIDCELEIRMSDPVRNEIIGVAVGKDEHQNIVAFIDVT